MSERLACEGGMPVRDTMRQPWPAWPVYGQEEEEALRRVLHSGQWWSAAGTEGERFAREFAAFQHAAFGVLCANGTLALEVALRALDIGRGDEVVMPAYTFVATASAVIAVGATPVFADIEHDTRNLDARSAADCLTNRTRAIIAVHVAGRPADMDTLQDMANAHGLALIEDAAQAHAASWRNRRVGALGTIGCFSFQASKNLNAGEGGIVLTDDEALADRAWSIINVGHLRKPEQPPVVGSNFRLTEFQGALLRAQLARLPGQTQTRSRNAHLLCELLKSVPGIFLPSKDPRITCHAYHLFSFRLDTTALNGKDRNDFVNALNAEGIPASDGYIPLYRNPLLINPQTTRDLHQECAPFYLPASEQVCLEDVWLPQNLLLGTEADMQDVLTAITKIMRAWL